MSGQRIHKLLELAGRSSTNENEALNAIRLIGNQLGSQGLTWADLPTLMGVDPSKLQTRTVMRDDPILRARVEDLERLLRASESGIAALQQELTKERQRASKTPKTVVKEVIREVIKEIPRIKYVDRPVETQVTSDTVSWSVFQRLARNILGDDWTKDPSRFGASQAMLKRWESTTQVPVLFLDKIARTRTFEVEKKRVEPKRRLDIRV